MRASTILALRSLLALVALMLALPAAAQERRPDLMDRGPAELLAEASVAPGGSTDLALRFRPIEGWHGYWSNPGDAGLGMTLDWDLPEGWEVKEPRYPVPQPYVLQGIMNHVYEGEHAVLVELDVPEAAAAGAYPVSVYAEWLTCSATLCVPQRATLSAMVTVGEAGQPTPRFDAWRSAIPALIDQKGNFELLGDRLRIGIPLPASLEIANPHFFTDNQELIAYAAPQIFRRDGDLLVVELALKPGATEPESVSGILKLDDAGNGVRFEAVAGDVPTGGTLLAGGAVADLPPLWSLLGLALLGGLLLNIMPCVFPILSLKAMSLARAGESEAAARRDGLAYTAGVVLACLALGALMLALRAAGNEIGWAFQLQEPGVVVALLVLAVAITANFAGLFELPSLSVTSDKPFGSFATGLLAAFVATPCTGPFMAAAMGAALLLPVPQALLLFAALGLGIALPFLALGFIPPLRKLLPRPGAWMNTFRKVMAVPMGLVALALAWLVWRLGGPWFAVFALLIAMQAVALIVTYRRGDWRVLAVESVILVMLLAYIPSEYEPQTAAAEESVIPAQPFSEAALAEARASGKPVFVWFTADWCLTCKVNEGVAIEREATRAAFEEAGVVALVGDWTRRDPAITRFLTAHGAAGVPLYLWYPAEGEAQQLPQVLTPDSLVSLAEAN